MSNATHSETESWPTIFSAETCTRKGLCPITDIKGQASNPVESHSLYFELHGSGREKILLIMGLNSSSFSWGRQVELLARDHSVLVFDNRGVGNSDSPRGPYTTSGMAEDAIGLIHFIGWSGSARDIHVVGVSLGGMVAQELSTRIPTRILSLTLSVTTPGGSIFNNLPPWKGFSTLAKLIFITDPNQKVNLILDMVFPTKWLDDLAEGEANKTNRVVQYEDYLRRVQITRPQKLIGHLSQMSAGLTHFVSPQRLQDISASIPKVTIVTGDDDHLVRPSSSHKLKAHMPEAELVIWQNTGHALHAQWPNRYFDLVTRTALEGRQRDSNNRS